VEAATGAAAKVGAVEAGMIEDGVVEATVAEDARQCPRVDQLLCTFCWLAFVASALWSLDSSGEWACAKRPRTQKFISKLNGVPKGTLFLSVTTFVPRYSSKQRQRVVCPDNFSQQS
jgi:hypothetical protein